MHIATSVQASDNPLVLESGRSKTGFLHQGESDAYHITASIAGNALLSLSTDASITLTIYKPDGTRQKSDYERRVLPLRIDQIGTYTVVVEGTDYGFDGGSYTLNFLRGGDSVKNGILSSGGTQSYELAPNAIESFQFLANEGDSGHFAVTSSFYTKMVFFKPDGSQLDLNSNNSSIYNDNVIIRNLPQTGTYTVAVQGKYSDSEGRYDIHYFRAGDAVKNGTLSSGKSYKFLKTPNSIESFRFSASAGEGVHFSLTADFDATAYIYKPDGSFWKYDSSKHLVLTDLPQSGTYTIVILSRLKADEGDYVIHYVRSGGAVTRGNLISGDTEEYDLSPNDLESFHFSAKIGESVHLNITSDFDTYIYVYAPDGTFYKPDSPNIHNERLVLQDLPQSGVYTVVVRASKLDHGPYYVHYVRGGDSVEDGLLISGHDRNDVLDLGGIES